MECLGIPIDHRLRRAIREARFMDRNGEESKHIRLLHCFGSSLDEGDYPIRDLSFALEMARPALKGGVLVVLQRPYSKQETSDGFSEGKRNCPSINAVSELVSAVNNAKLCFDDISLFDAIPLWDETLTSKDHKHLIDEAQKAFDIMVRAKDPEIIICCFQTETSNTLVENLQSRGVGLSFNPDNPASKLTEFGLSSIRVNAFHPSYAINRYPMFCCLKQLLVLEFTKAFALWRQNWAEKPWMKLLRDECKMRAKDNIYGKDISRNWNRPYLKMRWEDLLASLDVQFEECLLQSQDNIWPKDMQSRLVDSKITWLCCDIAWILEKVNKEESASLDMPQQLLRKLRSWCLKAWPGDKLRRSSSGSYGYYDHLPLLLIQSERLGTFAKMLENRLFDLLRDLNLSYDRSRGEVDHLVDHNIVAQRCAFRRFAAAFENVLEEITEHVFSQGNTALVFELGHLSLN